MRKITADKVFPVSAPPIENGVVVLDDEGSIQEIGSVHQYDHIDLEYHRGVIVPGFVNSHCHLELSHMKGKVDTGTGLIPFITNVVRQRASDPDVIQDAIRLGDEEMDRNGIVAVGDISNVPDSFSQKEHSPIRYYTFIEMFDFMQDENAEACFDQYHAVFSQLPEVNGHCKSCVPHAPYTVSPALFRRIADFNDGAMRTISMHNQEMESENALFRDKTGGLIDFYRGFDISLDHIEAIGAGSIMYAIKYLDPNQRTLLVHNTLTTREEAEVVLEWSDHVYWTTCPNANLYIENRLPDYAALLSAGARMTIGTDSLTSNWQLSILEEMKTIAKYKSFLSFDQILRWATLNGAEALGFDDMLGSIEVGKTPGLCLLDFDPGQSTLHDQLTVTRIA